MRIDEAWAEFHQFAEDLHSVVVHGHLAADLRALWNSPIGAEAGEPALAPRILQDCADLLRKLSGWRQDQCSRPLTYPQHMQAHSS